MALVDSVCPIALTMNMIGGKWKILILWNLKSGPVRFGDLKYGVDGISDKMLAQSLRELQADGLIKRKSYPQIPPRVEYNLTGSGWSLMRIVDSINDWGETFVNRHPDKACSSIISKLAS